MLPVRSSSTLRWLLPVLSAALLLGLAGLSHGYTADDAFITGRYAQRLAGGLGYTFRDGAATDVDRTGIIIMYAVNFVFHFLWSPLFFNLRRPDWALVEVVFLWVSVLALCIGLRPYSVLASWLIVPYLSWVSFAAVLNLNIVRLNKPFGNPQ